MQKILLITGSFGNGHLQVSKAVRENFEKNYKEEVIVIESDLFLQAHPNLTPILKKLYLYSFSYFRGIYGYLYYTGKNQVESSFYRYFSYEYLTKLLENEHPDIIVSTFPTPALSLLDGKIPVVNIVTDYRYHKSWITKGAKSYYVATEESKKDFEKVGVDSKKLKVFGIPISEVFDEKINKDQWLKENRLDVTLKTILLSAGAFGVSDSFVDLVGEILEKNSNLQIVVICGKNTYLKEKLGSMYKENSKIKVLGYTSYMREWMQSCDILVTKAGGVTVSEALASNIPLILFNPVPGQEKENALYFEKENMGKIATTNSEVVEVISEMIDEKLLFTFKENMKIKYKSKACEKICSDILNLIK